jgi:integrase
LVDDFGISRLAFASEAARLTELLERYLATPHLWKPATVASHTHFIRSLSEDPLGRRRLVALTAGDVLAAICRWQSAGPSISTVSSRWLVLRSALSWAVSEGVLRSNPLAGTRGPARPRPRRHHTLSEVRRLHRCAEETVERATIAHSENPQSLEQQRLLFSAEQGLVLVRLAADSGARRGELAVLRLGDIEGRVLTIERGLSRGVLGSTKSERTRRLTLGSTTTSIICSQYSAWIERGVCPEFNWLFAPTPTRTSFMTADALSHNFRRLSTSAGVSNPAVLSAANTALPHLSAGLPAHSGCLPLPISLGCELATSPTSIARYPATLHSDALPEPTTAEVASRRRSGSRRVRT